MKNYIISGDYKGEVGSSRHGLYIKPNIFSTLIMDSSTVDSYEVIGEQSRKSMTSGVVRGVAGAALFGGVGAVAGAMSGKSKTKHQVAVYFKNGKKILMELDDAYFQTFIKHVF